MSDRRPAPVRDPIADQIEQGQRIVEQLAVGSDELDVVVEDGGLLARVLDFDRRPRQQVDVAIVEKVEVAVSARGAREPDRFSPPVELAQTALFVDGEEFTRVVEFDVADVLIRALRVNGCAVGIQREGLLLQL